VAKGGFVFKFFVVVLVAVFFSSAPLVAVQAGQQFPFKANPISEAEKISPGEIGAVVFDSPSCSSCVELKKRMFLQSRLFERVTFFVVTLETNLDFPADHKLVLAANKWLKDGGGTPLSAMAPVVVFFNKNKNGIFNVLSVHRGLYGGATDQTVPALTEAANKNFDAMVKVVEGYLGYRRM
jgi:thioredoxin-related protein